MFSDLGCNYVNPDSSVSTLAINPTLPPEHRKVPSYIHWFANGLCDVVDQVRVQTEVDSSEPLTLKLEGEEFTIDRAALQVVSASIKQYAQISSTTESAPGGIMGNSQLRACEIVYTGLTGDALRTFLDHEHTFTARAMFIHQAPSRKREGARGIEVADYGIAPYLRNTFYPGPYIAVWDGKRQSEDFNRADRQSAYYQINNLTLNEGISRTEWPVTVGMPGTKECSELQVYVPAAQSRLWRTAICKGNPWDVDLLGTFYVAIHYLLNHPIRQCHAPTVSMPEKGLDVKGVHQGDLCYRIYRYQDQVVKLYKNDNVRFHHNIELLEAIGLQHKLTNHGRFSSLSRKYIDAGHQPQSAGAFKGIITILNKIHDKGFVHGDIRIANMLFGEEESTLIDFDLARPEGKTYSQYFRPRLNWKGTNIRHATAQPWAYMKKEHDRYSLAMIISLSFPSDELAVKICDDLHNPEIDLLDILTKV